MLDGRAQPKLTPEVQNRICDAISAGNYRESACQYGGIDGATFYRWLGAAKGRRAVSRISRRRRAAEVAAEVRVVAQWQQHMPGDWRACRDFLARRFPERWSEKRRHEATGDVTARLTLEQAVQAAQELDRWHLGELTDAELEQYLALAEAVEARRAAGQGGGGHATNGRAAHGAAS